jgi:Cache domain
MTTSHPDEATRIRTAVTGMVERVFDTVAVLHAAALRCHQDAATAPGTPRRELFAGLEEPARTLLRAPGQVAVGLGMIVAPRPELALGLRLHWWQLDPASDLLLALDPDLRPASLGFYDYASAEWFDVPRSTGQRHVVGPYVDVHGTGRYLLTLTSPVVVDGQFLGVVGADVPVSRFESHLLAEVGPQAGAFAIVNAERRVVLSTSPEWLTGCLVPTDSDDPVDEHLPDLPWRLRASGRTNYLAPSTTEPHPSSPPAKGRKERP